MTDQSIEDASYETNIALREANHIHDADEYFKARPQIDSQDRRKVFESGYERGWQASRQSSQSEPVASIVQEIFDLCIQYERSCYNTGYLHLAEKLLVLAGRANSAIKIMEQPLAAPQQAIPAEHLLVWALRKYIKGELCIEDAEYALKAHECASPTAPIESDK
jgi:hypothetical protein